MALMRGKLFAGALFAGNLFGGNVPTHIDWLIHARRRCIR